MHSNLELRKRFEECVDAHSDSMFRVAYRLTGCHGLAAELVQETFAGAWKNLSTINQSKKLRSWMFSIMRNQFRKSNRNRIQTSQMVFTDEEAIPDESIRFELERNEDRDLVQRALSTLNPDQRMPLLLVSMEGLTVDEAAEVMQIPRGTVLSRLHRGKQQVKDFISRHDESYRQAR